MLKHNLKTDQRDACRPSYWKNRWLTYTDHAVAQAAERQIPMLPRLLPSRIRLVDCDLTWRGIQATVWKFLGTTDTGEDAHFLVVRNTGEVVTVFRLDETWPDVCQRKAYRRQILGRMSWHFLEGAINCEEARAAEQLIDERHAAMTLYREQCFGKQVDKMRRRRREREKHGGK